MIVRSLIAGTVSTLIDKNDPLPVQGSFRGRLYAGAPHGGVQEARHLDVKSAVCVAAVELGATRKLCSIVARGLLAGRQLNQTPAMADRALNSPKASTVPVEFAIVASQCRRRSAGRAAIARSMSRFVSSRSGPCPADHKAPTVRSPQGTKLVSAMRERRRLAGYIRRSFRTEPRRQR